jgi:transposase
VRHRLNRGGNRRLNAILYRIALTQAQSSSQGRAYIDRRRREGKTWREAVRALKRFLARAICDYGWSAKQNQTRYRNVSSRST